MKPVDTRKNDVNRVEYYLRFVVTVQFSSTRTFNATSFDHRPMFLYPLFLLHFKPFRCYLMRFLLYDVSRCPHQRDSGRVVHLTWSAGYNLWGGNLPGFWQEQTATAFNFYLFIYSSTELTLSQYIWYWLMSPKTTRSFSKKKQIFWWLKKSNSAFTGI